MTLNEYGINIKKEMGNIQGDLLAFIMIGLLREISDKLDKQDEVTLTNKEIIKTLIDNGVDEKELKGKNKEQLISKAKELDISL